MNTIKQRITALSLICLSLFVPSISNAQHEIDSTELKLALMERSYFMEEDIYQKNSLLFDKGLTLKSLERYHEAAETFNRIRPKYIADSLSFYLYYESAFCNYMINNYEKAKFYLFRINNKTISSDKSDRKRFLQILIYNSLAEWQEAATLIEEFNYLSSKEKADIKDRYNAIKQLKLKDLEKTEKLSSWLPGVGQMYAGKFWRGLTSSTLQLGLLGFAGYSFLNGYYFSGSFTGVSLFYVFYMGGIRHSVYLAEEYNKNILSEHIEPIENTLIEAIKKGRH